MVFHEDSKLMSTRVHVCVPRAVCGLFPPTAEGTGPVGPLAFCMPGAVVEEGDEGDWVLSPVLSLVLSQN